MLPILAWMLALLTAKTGAQTIAIIRAKAYLRPGSAPLSATTILIQNGRISAAGTGIGVPAGFRVVDAANRIVTPGLMNSGTELGLVESGSEDTTDHAVTSGPLGAAFDVQYALNPNSTLLPVARADGLTRAVTYPSGSAGTPFTGLGAVLRLSEGSEILDRARVALFAVIGGMASSQVGGSRSAQWILLRHALNEASHYQQLSRQNIAPSAKGRLFSPINLEALLPVINGKIPLVITVHRESDIRQAIALRQDYSIRVIIFGGDEAWRVADLLAARKIPVVLNPYANVPATFDQIGARLDNAALLQRAGVSLSFSVPGIHLSHNAGSIIREGAGIAVANGLPWDEALKAMTVNPAETWGITDHYGTLEPGKDADVVIWNGDPLEPISAPDQVFVQGKEVSLRTRQTDLQERYAPRYAHDPWPPAYR